MSSSSCYLGVDVSKDTLVVAHQRRRWQFANTQEGHRKFIAQIQKLSASGHVVCESTGAYHLPMCLALQEAGIACTIANAARIHYFGRSEGIIAKNDPIDAELIERFAQAKRPPADPPLCREQLALSESVTHRQQLVEMIKVLRTHRQQVLNAALVTEIDKSIDVLEKRLEALDRKLRAKIDAQPLWKAKSRCSLRPKGSALSRPSPSWRRCPNWAPSTAVSVPRWRDWLPMMTTAASTRENAPSAAAATKFAPPSTWRP
jgi:transposase